MSAYEFIIFFSVSLVSGVIALICWLLELTCKKLHLNAISEIFNILKCTADFKCNLVWRLFYTYVESYRA